MARRPRRSGASAARLLAAPLALALVASCEQPETDGEAAADEATAQITCSADKSPVVRIAGSSFEMGAEGVLPGEGPAREVAVSDFWIDRYEVTVGEFARFVDATGYVTKAERLVDPAEFGVERERIPPDLLKPGSAVFRMPEKPPQDYRDWWVYVPGADWRSPAGPEGPAARPDEPVVHLTWDDMTAFAEWKGGRLPSEAEWEYAALGGEAGSRTQPEVAKANTWQGVFPVRNTGDDGFEGRAPVGCFEPNGFGLHDMIGNVWEMTADPYSEANLDQRLAKGGSFLCAPNYCQRYRPAARHPQDSSIGASNVGFRLVYDKAPGPPSGP